MKAFNKKNKPKHSTKLKYVDNVSFCILSKKCSITFWKMDDFTTGIFERYTLCSI